MLLLIDKFLHLALIVRSLCTRHKQSRIRFVLNSKKSGLVIQTSVVFALVYHCYCKPCRTYFQTLPSFLSLNTMPQLRFHLAFTSSIPCWVKISFVARNFDMGLRVSNESFDVFITNRGKLFKRNLIFCSTYSKAVGREGPNC